MSDGVMPVELVSLEVLLTNRARSETHCMVNVIENVLPKHINHTKRFLTSIYHAAASEYTLYSLNPTISTTTFRVVT